jgi:hypothetical protein
VALAYRDRRIPGASPRVGYGVRASC